MTGENLTFVELLALSLCTQIRDFRMNQENDIEFSYVNRLMTRPQYDVVKLLTS